MEDEVVESAEQTEGASTFENSESQPESTDAPEQEASATDDNTDEKPLPFHEHPRFKELVEERKAYKEQVEKLQQDFQRLQQESQSFRQPAPKVEEPKDKFLEKLAEIDPAYAESLKGMYEAAKVGKDAMARLQQMEQQQFAQTAQNHFKTLLETNKVSDELKSRYEREVRALVYEEESKGKKLGLSDLDRHFNTVHTEYTKFLKDYERKLTASYAASKKKDAAPRATTGGQPTPASGMKKFDSMTSPEAIKWVAQQMRASRNQD
ncbi:unnamed protein product [Sphagnum balticum]